MKQIREFLRHSSSSSQKNHVCIANRNFFSHSLDARVVQNILQPALHINITEARIICNKFLFVSFDFRYTFKHIYCIEALHGDPSGFCSAENYGNQFLNWNAIPSFQG